MSLAVPTPQEQRLYTLNSSTAGPPHFRSLPSGLNWASPSEAGEACQDSPASWLSDSLDFVGVQVQFDRLEDEVAAKSFIGLYDEEVSVVGVM